ncbi:hypothetical protein EZS27_024967, partial [termite gut metagenome]
IVVGIDVSKEKLDFAFKGQGKRF